jgi:hypothetical protein
MMGASQANGLGSAEAPEPSGLGPTGSIPSAVLAIIAETNHQGSLRRPGDYIGEWEEGDHPYGKASPCPFCKEEQNYTTIWYNGPGSPPSYAWCCCSCSAQGPTSSGTGRGDHYGAIMDARKLWDAASCDTHRNGGDA